ncbi:MAG: HPr family phosphocarrier protein [Lachnospiraceae bacterium]|nr:HPr family phosphocarrier protein [Lachnospiraceae bacterium]
MREHKIKLSKEEVKDFVIRASKCDFDIDVSYNHITVDAKSILGVLALDLRQILTVSCNGYSADFEKYLTSKVAMVA